MILHIMEGISLLEILSRFSLRFAKDFFRGRCEIPMADVIGSIWICTNIDGTANKSRKKIAFIFLCPM
jgi:hypothetical protein